MSNVVIIDYGMSNLRSVQRGLEKVGAKVTLSSTYSDITKADHLVLPGVGAFEAGMNGLKNVGLVEAIYDFVKTGNSLLGICLGMQMLLDYSEENGNHQGLGLIAGSVKKIPEGVKEEGGRKIPHIGWATLQEFSLHYLQLTLSLDDCRSLHYSLITFASLNRFQAENCQF
jgi:glutamine amidotransferase